MPSLVLGVSITLALIAILASVFIIIYLDKQNRQEIRRIQKEWSDSLNQQTTALNQQIQHLSQNLQSSLSETQKSVQIDLKSSNHLMSDIHTSLGELKEVSKRIYHIGEDITSLQDLLRAPKFRGGIGEYLLEDLLSQILPSNFYETQHLFKDGVIVDALIRIGDYKLCIDSKFPLESFQLYQTANEEKEAEKMRKEFLQCVKKHINSIQEKYILPDEGTLDFALMYIPAENIYYETIIRSQKDDIEKNSLFEYSIQKRVIPVSPNSIYAYLQVILIGLRGFKIEHQAKEILAKLSGMKIHVDKFTDEFTLMGKHLANSTKSFDKAQNKLTKLHGDLERIDLATDPDPALSKTPASQRK